MMKKPKKPKTKDLLADELMKLGLMDMSLQARGGYYHDFLSPLATPELQLCDDLAKAVAKADGEFSVYVFDCNDDYEEMLRFVVDADGPKPSAGIIIANDLDRLQDVLCFEMHLTCLARSPEDGPKIVETWL